MSSKGGLCPILLVLELCPGVHFKPEIIFMSTFLTS